MTTVQITTPSGTTDGSVELPDAIFDVTANVPLMHQVVVAQLAAARQGTHKAKNRGEVSGGGKKPYRQKGTGRARQGSTRAPQFNGGGTVHGPVPHGYAQRTPKKMKAAALRGALSDRARGGNVHVLSALVDGTAPSTKTARSALNAVSTAKKILVVLSSSDDVGWKSLRNVPEVHLITAGQLNTYDVLVSDDVVFTRSALEEFLVAKNTSADFSDAPEGVSAGRHAAPDEDAADTGPEDVAGPTADTAPEDVAGPTADTAPEDVGTSAREDVADAAPLADTAPVTTDEEAAT